MSHVDLSIIVVNWKSAAYVRACVRSIVEQTAATRYEVVVVDNASFDSCGEELAQDYPSVVFVQSHDNLGFGGANNLGVKHARGSVLLFLNPDTEVRSQAIDCMYRHFQGMPDVGIVGCRLLNTDGSLQTSCVQALPTVWNQMLDADLLRRWLPRASLWGTAAFYANPRTPVDVEALSGACMMIRREVFEAVHGFSPAFFMYGEDLDLCDRVRAAGFHNRYVGEPEIVHHGGGSSQHMRSTFSAVMMRESVATLLRRSQGAGASAGYRAGTVLVACLRVAILVVACPVWLVRRDIKSWKGACRKWLAILGWGLGLDRRARRAGQLHQNTELSARV